MNISNILKVNLGGVWRTGSRNWETSVQPPVSLGTLLYQPREKGFLLKNKFVSQFLCQEVPGIIGDPKLGLI